MSHVIVGHPQQKRPRLLLTAIAIATLLGSALVLLAGAAPASASTLSVCQRGCAYTQIAAAVAAASDGDTVTVAPGMYLGGFTIDQNLSLNGAGARRTIIRGGGPVLTIGSATTSPSVTITGLTVTGGVTTTDPQAPRCGPDVPTCGAGYTTATALGGGIEVFAGATVRLLDSVVSGNLAEPALSVPSVRAVCPGPSACAASFGDGAGIDNWGTMTLIGTTVRDNHAAASQSDGGGIVDESGATLSLQASTVTGNTVSAAPPTGRFAAGGGIFVDTGASLTVDNSAIDDNSSSLANSIPSPYPMQEGGTDQESAYTGGVYLADGSTAEIRNSDLEANTVTVNAPVGQPYGADAALCVCGDVPLTLENSRVDDNSVTVNVLSSDANGPSGPAAVEADGNATIANTQITGNAISVTTPNGDAGAVGAIGLFFGGTLTPTITNSIISGNTSAAVAPSGTATIQGAGLVNNGPLALKNVLVSNNHGTATGLGGFAEGGGIWNGILFGGPTSPLTLKNTLVIANSLGASPGLSLQGAGIFTAGVPITLDNSLVVRNSPDQCYGC